MFVVEMYQRTPEPRYLHTAEAVYRLHKVHFEDVLFMADGQNWAMDCFRYYSLEKLTSAQDIMDALAWLHDHRGFVHAWFQDTHVECRKFARTLHGLL